MTFNSEGSESEIIGNNAGLGFRAFELAKAAGIPVIFDVDYRPYSWPSQQMAEEVLSKAGDMSDIIVANDEEFGFMAGMLKGSPAEGRKKC